MSSLSFVGKTAVITGAGGALGRAYAFDLAKRGCNLLINDIFGSLTGDTTQTVAAENAAEKLTHELRQFGIKASYNTDSVTNGNKIIETAFKQFGRVDIVINNAGNLRDKSFGKMTVEEWESVINIHLHGTFQVCHAVWPILQQQNYGRIINVGSAAGLYGNFGQANYSSAKMGILGLTNTLAKEGEKYNITVNCVTPIAGSRMTETILPPDLLKTLKPEHVAPFVTYLAHEDTKITGACFEVGGGWYSQIRLQRSAGRHLAKDENTVVTAEQIKTNIDQIRDFSDSVFPTNPADSFRSLALAKDKQSSVDNDATKTAESVTNAPATQKKAPELVTKHDYVLEHLKTYLAQAKPEDLQKVRTKIVYEVKIDANTKKYWFINTKDSNLPPIAVITEAEINSLSPHAVVKCSEDTFIGLAEGKLSPEFSYMKGSLQITGNLNAALKLKTILENARKVLQI